MSEQSQYLIQRDIYVEAPIEIVWEVVTTPRHINAWFTDACELELEPGAAGSFTWNRKASTPHDGDFVAPLVVQSVDPPRSFSFTWCHNEAGDGAALVRFDLASEGSGTRVTVVESQLDQLALATAELDAYRADHTDGWRRHLADLAEYAPGVRAGSVA